MRLKKLSLCLSAVIILGSSAFFGAAVRASETAGEGATAVETAPAVEENAGDSLTDAAGNVVCRTHSNGGTAIWDGRTLSGSKAHSGVYTIYCNTADGKNHTALKLLIMH